MGVPKEILEIERPFGTVVMKAKNPGPNQWIVRARKGYKPKPDEQVILNQVVGHIYEGQYVPVMKKHRDRSIAECLSYGASTYAQKFTADLQKILAQVFPLDDVASILAIAILKVIKPGISNARLQAAYNRTYLTISLKGAHLSKDSIGALIDMIGRKDSCREKFARLRLENVMAEHHVAIDGTLIQNTSTVNNLSEWSFKSRERKHKDISVIYAYDIELREPICSTIYPGNCTDATVYENFIETNGVSKGILVADKGFPPAKIRALLKKYPDLKYITPIKRNDARIEKYGALTFTNTLQNTDKHIYFSKVKVSDDLYLYTFKDIKKEYLESTAYLDKTQRKREGVVNSDELNKKEKTFGTITFESNCDIDPEIVYSTYQNRWVIEVMFNQYKSELDFDKTGVQSDFSVIGENFINQISATIASRMVSDLQQKEILKQMRFSEVIDDLSGLWRKTDAPAPKQGDKYWRTNVEHVFELAETLEICDGKGKQESKSRGRPKKENVESKEKRPRGRPKKIIENPQPKRPRGRPKKIIENPQQKRPRGRPKKDKIEGSSTF